VRSTCNADWVNTERSCSNSWFSFDLRQARLVLLGGESGSAPEISGNPRKGSQGFSWGIDPRQRQVAKAAALTRRVAPRPAETELLEARLERAWFQSQAGSGTVLAPDAPSCIVEHLQDVCPLEGFQIRLGDTLN
jgi:hypothetical protein